VSIGRDGGVLHVAGTVPTERSAPPQLDRIVSELLEVCADSWALDCVDGQLRFRVAVRA
jgi:hypothetical protein